jgi:PBP1b-binding outer membrane lipoprotein LpoB
MKKITYLLLLILVITSCVKEEIKPQQPLGPQPIITDTTSVDSTINLKNTTWVITKILNTSFNQEMRSDTLVFISNNVYSFNGVQSTYNFYPSQSNYTLTLNNTPWGHISGSMYDYNLTQGILENSQFVNYFTNQNSVKIWMERQ